VLVNNDLIFFFFSFHLYKKKGELQVNWDTWWLGKNAPIILN